MRFAKYHALGNDYIVMTEEQLGQHHTVSDVRRICDRNFGIGSDGILVHRHCETPGQFALRILNPDGSEAEKSGNGLRIFARYLFDQGLVQEGREFQVQTLGGAVACTVLSGRGVVTVDMGRVSFQSDRIPVIGEVREVLREQLTLEGTTVEFCAATIGNPHCVVTSLPVTQETARRFGPLLENHPNFPNRTNVQFLEVLDRNTIRLEIWERGAGYTLASGSSSSAATAVARRLGLVDSDVTVVMPGGTLRIEVSADFDIRMTGAVTRVFDGELFQEALQ
jgi:diaminopimelate epimerase